MAKELFIKHQKSTHEILEECLLIAEIEKLKELIISKQEGAEKELDNFIKEKWNKAEENQRKILDIMNQ